VLPLWRVEHDVADMAFGCAHGVKEHFRCGADSYCL
jgi:hypothetical protein